MAQNKSLLFPILFVTLLSACSIKENIQRDINVKTDYTLFTIPVTTNLVDTVSLAEINEIVDLNAMVNQTTNQFSAADLKSIHINGFRIQFKDDVVQADPEVDAEADTDDDTEIDEVNNFKAFDYLRVQLKAPNKDLLTIGQINNSAMQSASSIDFQITAKNQDIKDYLNAGTFTYVITGVARTATTKIIDAKAFAQYKLTLGM